MGLARYVFEAGLPFEEGHNFNMDAPLTQETGLTALLFASDSTLETIETPNGSVAFLQVVGIAADELEAVNSWNGSAFLDLLKERDPLLMTDLKRRSLLQDESIATRIQQGIERDGSSLFAVFTDLAGWVRSKKSDEEKPGVELALGPTAARELLLALKTTIRRGRPRILVGGGDLENCEVLFVRSETAGWLVEEADTPDGRPCLVVQLTEKLIAEMEASVTEAPGVHQWPGLERLTLRVLPESAVERIASKRRDR